MGLFTKDIKTMNDLFVHQLQDIYYAEQQLTKALPKMADKATDPQLKQGFLTHLEETKQHVKRLEEVFKMHGAQVRSLSKHDGGLEAYVSHGAATEAAACEPAPSNMNLSTVEPVRSVPARALQRPSRLPR